MTAWIIGLAVVVLLVVWLRNNATASASVIITGPGVLKTHDVECKFRSDAGYHGKLSQSRWSDGQERFTLNLRKLPSRYSGSVGLFYQGSHVGDFEAKSGAISFSAKGMVDDGKPQFDIGEQVRLDFGGHSLTGIVEPD